MGAFTTLQWTVGGLMAALVVLGLSRLVCVRHSDRLLDLAEILMGAGMAAMLFPSLNPLPARIWAAVFVADAILLAGARSVDAIRVRRHSHVRGRRHTWDHYVHQVIANLAMGYLLVAMTGPASPNMPMPDTPAMGAPPAAMSSAFVPDLPIQLLAVVLIGYFLAHAVWTTLRLTIRMRRRDGEPRQPNRLAGLLVARPLTTGRHIAMAVGMAAMLAPMV